MPTLPVRSKSKAAIKPRKSRFKVMGDGRIGECSSRAPAAAGASTRYRIQRNVGWVDWRYRGRFDFTPPALHVGGDAGDALADHQLVNVVGAFVGEDAFEVVHVAHDAVIVDDAIGAEDVASFAGGIQRDAHVVHFEHGDVRGIYLAVVL